MVNLTGDLKRSPHNPRQLTKSALLVHCNSLEQLGALGYLGALLGQSGAPALVAGNKTWV